MNVKKIILFLSIFILGYFAVNFLIERKEFTNFRNIFTTKVKFIVKKHFFPYKYISQLEETLINNRIYTSINNVYFALNEELKFQKKLKNFEAKKVYRKKLKNNKFIDIYKLSDGFYSGINNAIPGSGFIDFLNDDIIIVSSKGTLGYSKLNYENLNFNQIKNNINEFINFKQFSKHNWFSIKDLLIHKDLILISYTEEIKENCWNTSIIYGKFDYDMIKFSKLFSSKDCIHSLNNVDKEFNAHQSGGRIVSLDENNIIFTLGDYRSRNLAQNLDFLNGKIIKIDLKSKGIKIVSIGHRNPQGLYLDKERNFLIETEHGPKGGDEINIIDLNINEKKNYGWPVASYGEHYKKYNQNNIDKYKKYPLYKNHKKHNFIEPLRYFTPSIGVSEITKIGNNEYVMGTLANRSLYFFELNDKNMIDNMRLVNINERVRDIKYYKNKIFLFLEDTASIGIISY